MIKRVNVPEGMLKAAIAAVKISISGTIVRNQVHGIVEAALGWLSEHYDVILKGDGNAKTDQKSA